MKYLLLLIIGSMLIASCAVNKLTGKSQLSLLSDDEIFHTSDSMYRDYLKKSKVISTRSDVDVQMVQVI